jgi:hypothetical protein
MMGTIVWGEKPNKPVKPENPGKSVKSWDLTIRIGIGELKGENEPEDVVLTFSTHSDQDGYYLFTEDIPCSGGLWDLPNEKGKSRMTSYVSGQVSIFSMEGDDCGDYQLADVVGHNSDGIETSLHDFPLENEDIVYVSIRHQINPLDEDFWSFWIQWIIDSETYEGYQLMAWTNKNPDDEGTSSDKGWLVEFEGAEAMIYYLWDWVDENPLDGMPDVYDWLGYVSFTVTIARTQHVA